MSWLSKTTEKLQKKADELKAKAEGRDGKYNPDHPIYHTIEEQAKRKSQNKVKKEDPFREMTMEEVREESKKAQKLSSDQKRAINFDGIIIGTIACYSFFMGMKVALEPDLTSRIIGFSIFSFMILFYAGLKMSSEKMKIRLFNLGQAMVTKVVELMEDLKEKIEKEESKK